MNIEQIIRAWKDADYRESLASEEQGLLPPNPAEIVDLTDTELEAVAGAKTNCDWSLGCCPFFTSSCPSDSACSYGCPTALTCIPCAGG